ncbi:NAD-dependent epimerase/dehydratase family protein [Kordiimonas laminariae]|uniref:NAD-dependent epimerase/dehydratase family protein n=1 Tax=Kordiimonas laminariae TaxID=2917717 RepID=UPI001FF1F21B|nr:NAD-dependent epimerase/dehydratase family protein [Kordiimonas laminariae]MCK0068587.1 NAD-dependent epimerase/dehydratase family protein [Kordiimonas laminariae]
MTILVTGVAGFIGMHVAKALLDKGESVLGIDNLNDYYDPALKNARLQQLDDYPAFTFKYCDFANNERLIEATSDVKLKAVIHLGAQAGVRYSIDNPAAYIQSNLVGHANILEVCRHSDSLDHLVYASSSSVYGGNTKLPFSVDDPVDTPVSLYAATKRADEILSQSYAHLYGLPQTGLRFFTVYGPWGRPDMALWLFTEAILNGKPIRVFNHGDMARDFTYIDDIVGGILSTLEKPPVAGSQNAFGGSAPHKIYNIGNNKPEPLLDMISVLEEALGTKAEKQFEPMQAGDVKETFADTSALEADVGFKASTPISVGIPNFVDWYKGYHQL